MCQKLKLYGNQICGYNNDKHVPAFHFLTLSQETLTMFLGVNKVRYYYPHFTNKKQQRFGPKNLLQDSISELAFEYRFCDSESIGEASIPYG